MRIIILVLVSLFAASLSAATCQEFWDDPTLVIDDNLACLSWAVPTQNADGSAITDLAGYNLYYGNNSASLDQTVLISNAAADGYNLDITVTQPTTYYFEITAFDASGNESVRSAQFSKEIRLVDNIPPATPSTFRVQMRVRVPVPGGELVHP